MFTPKLLNILSALSPVWVNEHRTHTASRNQLTTSSIVAMQEDGYELLQRAGEVAFMHNSATGDRIEIIPKNEDFVPHQAFAFKTSDDYSKAVVILKARSDLGIKFFKKGGDDENLSWVMFSYKENGQIYYVQFLWRKEPVFPNLPWPKPPTTE